MLSYKTTQDQASKERYDCVSGVSKYFHCFCRITRCFTVRAARPITGSFDPLIGCHCTPARISLLAEKSTTSPRIQGLSGGLSASRQFGHRKLTFGRMGARCLCLRSELTRAATHVMSSEPCQDFLTPTWLCRPAWLCTKPSLLFILIFANCLRATRNQAYKLALQLHMFCTCLISLLLVLEPAALAKSGAGY